MNNEDDFSLDGQTPTSVWRYRRLLGSGFSANKG